MLCCVYRESAILYACIIRSMAVYLLKIMANILLVVLRCGGVGVNVYGKIVFASQ